MFTIKTRIKTHDGWDIYKIDGDQIEMLTKEDYKKITDYSKENNHEPSTIDVEGEDWLICSFVSHLRNRYRNHRVKIVSHVIGGE